jgi:hypothetical protein
MANSASQGVLHTSEYLYSFAAQGGTAGTVDLGDLPLGAVVTNVAWVCEAAITSAGSGATLALGTTAATTALINTGDAEALYQLNFTDSAAPYANGVIAAGATTRDVLLTIGGENFTAGKVRFIISFYIPSNITLSE